MSASGLSQSSHKAPFGGSNPPIGTNYKDTVGTIDTFQKPVIVLSKQEDVIL